MNYRYSFNGKEKDDEAFEGCLAFEARIFDGRLGRFLSLDPRMAEYAWQTPYAYFKNCPVSVLDIAGMGGPYQEDGGSTTQGCGTSEDPNTCASGAQGAVSSSASAPDPDPVCGPAPPPQFVADQATSNCTPFVVNSNTTNNVRFDWDKQVINNMNCNAVDGLSDEQRKCDLCCLNAFASNLKVLYPNDNFLTNDNMTAALKDLIISGKAVKVGVAQPVDSEGNIVNSNSKESSFFKIDLAGTLNNYLRDMPNGIYVFAVGLAMEYHSTIVVVVKDDLKVSIPKHQECGDIPVAAGENRCRDEYVALQASSAAPAYLFVEDVGGARTFDAAILNSKAMDFTLGAAKYYSGRKKVGRRKFKNNKKEPKNLGANVYILGY